MPSSRHDARTPTQSPFPPVRDRGSRPTMYVTKKAVAERLDVSVKTVTRLMNSGQLRFHKIGGQVRISEEDLAAFMAARRH